MINYYYKNSRDSEFKKLKKHTDGCWIEATNTTYEDIEKISDIINLNIENITDALDDLELPRIERKGNHILIFTRIPSARESNIYTETLTFIVSDKFITTISLSEAEIIESIHKTNSDLATTQKSKFLAFALIKIAQEFTTKIKQHRKTVMKQSKKISAISNMDIIKLNELEEILNQYSSTLIQMKKIFEYILQGSYIKTFQEDSDIFEDLHISINQSVDTCNVNLNTIRSTRDSYQIIFTNNLNKEIMLLTYMTIALAIPTLIGSIYGMNINLPMQNNPHAFLVVMIISVIGLVLSVIFIPKMLKKIATMQSNV